MKYWLVVYILLNGVWTPGAEVKPVGWHPRAYSSLAECETRKAFATRAVKKASRAAARWFCTLDREASLADLEKAAGE